MRLTNSPLCAIVLLAKDKSGQLLPKSGLSGITDLSSCIIVLDFRNSLLLM